jgi:hypothetical protein
MGIDYGAVVGLLGSGTEHKMQINLLQRFVWLRKTWEYGKPFVTDRKSSDILCFLSGIDPEIWISITFCVKNVLLKSL